MYPPILTDNKIKIMKTLINALLIAALVTLTLTSCNVTRTVTTQSEYWQKGDTSVIIQSRTVESYDGTRK